ncbi:hypothetical protein OQH61_08005 [Helicobacter sp. MIT 21-1697]|uniref:hypothetical protein n=1 Tax=Helicobacter sp. MIT 21-1697 TaxID=2993733 RepID=UPI00224A4E7F|nr:hypothetical protein [Helicobacter sp. MIT 21-1697]MCX2717676.1 hypothetical protein [Helicobacter sp. MIT 21-1697]
MKYLRKILLSASLFGAVCAYAGEYSALKIGIGGVYILQQPSDEKDITNTSAYLALRSRYSFLQERILLQLEVETNIGKTKRERNKSNSLRMENFLLGAGVNLLTPNTPLYLSVMYGMDNFEYWASNSWVDNGLMFVGADLQGFIKSNHLTFEYNVGYHYVLTGYYEQNQNNYVRVDTDSSSYAIKGGIGFVYDITQHIGLFMNLRAKYYNIAASKFNAIFTRPTTKHFLGGVEVGIKF